jgi:toxin ParE1/3/4
MRIRYTPRARDDLGEILKYIDERSPRGAHNVKRSIKRTIELIGQFPQAGRLAGVPGTRVGQEISLSHLLEYRSG